MTTKVDEIRARLAAISPWPWQVERDGKTEEDKYGGWPVASCGSSNEDGADYGVTSRPCHASDYEGDARDDAAFIASAPADVARMIEAHEVLTRARAAAVRERDEARTALASIASEVMEPETLSEGCPPLAERIVGAIRQLAHERTEARTEAHEYAAALLRAHRDHEVTARERDDALGQIERLTREVERLRGLMPTPWTASCEKHGGALAPSPGATCARCDDEVERLRAVGR